MLRPKRRAILLVALGLLLAASLAANVVLYPLATRSLYQEGERDYIERTIALHARGSQSRAAEIRSTTFPIVMRIPALGLVCVELRFPDEMGNLMACYDRSGRVTAESETVV